MFRAKVHKNGDGLLHVHADLVQKSFGIRKRKGQGRCLITQVAYSIAACCPGLSASRVAAHIDRYITRDVSENGHTINEIWNVLNNVPIVGDRGVYELKVEVHKHRAYEEVLVAVLNGQPVIFMIDRDVCAVLMNEAQMYQDGEIRSTVIRHGRTGLYHAMLAIGVDLSGFLILRDSRHTQGYAFKGYAKLATHLIQDGWRYLDCMSLEVTSMRKISN